MNFSHKKPRWQRLSRQTKATLRDTWLLVREFQWPLLAFMGAILGGGVLYHHLSKIAAIQTNETVSGLVRSIYQVLGLVFLSPLGEFPQVWYLQVFYFLMPIIGLSILAQGITDFGILFFNRQSRSKEWEMAVASTFTNHVVLIGLGHLGYRVAHHLHSMGEEVVAIELNPKADLISNIKDLGIPVIADDAARESILTATNISQAKAVILCTQNDSLNLQVALKARRLNPDVQVVLRIFDDEFARSLQKQFGFQALSTTATASPVFAAAAVGVDMTRPITVEGKPLNLARIKIMPQSQLVGLSVEQVEYNYAVSVVLLRRENESADFHPGPDRLISQSDILAILGGPKEINYVAQKNC